MNAKIDRSSQKGASNLEVGAGAAIRNKVARKCIPEKAASEPLEVETGKPDNDVTMAMITRAAVTVSTHVVLSASSALSQQFATLILHLEISKLKSRELRSQQM